MANLGQYLKETRNELRHVAWPTRSQTIWYTVIVIGLSVAISLYLGVFDFLFSKGLSTILNSTPAQSPIQVQQTPATTTLPVPVFGTSTTQ